MISTPPVTVERLGLVAIVWLDRPDQRNAFGPEFWSLLPDLMEDLGGDPGVRAIVVAASGNDRIRYLDSEIPDDLEAWIRLVHHDDRRAFRKAIDSLVQGQTPEMTSEPRSPASPKTLSTSSLVSAWNSSGVNRW